MERDNYPVGKYAKRVVISAGTRKRGGARRPIGLINGLTVQASVTHVRRMRPDEGAADDRQEGIDRLMADIEQESARVGVDWDLAHEQLREMAPRTETESADGESHEIAIGLDVTSVLETLRSLPDGAGTAAFLAAISGESV